MQGQTPTDSLVKTEHVPEINSNALEAHVKFFPRLPKLTKRVLIFFRDSQN